MADGPLAVGSFRVVVCEPDGRVTCRDFAALDEARSYADDAASEAEAGPVVATVLDERFAVVHRGRHY